MKLAPRSTSNRSRKPGGPGITSVARCGSSGLPREIRLSRRAAASEYAPRGVAHLEAREFLVAGAGAAAVIVARRDEAPAVPEWPAVCIRLVEIRESGGVLRVRSRADREHGFEAVAALVAVEPLLLAGVGDDPVRLGACLHDQALGLFDAPLALLRRKIAAARADQLAGTPAAGQVLGGRRGTDALAGCVPLVFGEVAELLAIAVAREGLEQELAIGILLGADQRVAKVCARRRVHAPGEAMRDHDRVEAPLRELLEELSGVGAFSRQSSGSSRVSRPTSQLGRSASCCTRQRKFAYSGKPT